MIQLGLPRASGDRFWNRDYTHLSLLTTLQRQPMSMFYSSDLLCVWGENGKSMHCAKNLKYKRFRGLPT